MSVAIAPDTGCNRCGSPLEDGDLRCAVCALPVAVVRSTVEKIRVQVLRCTWCGAAIGFDANHQAPKCGFCNSVMVVEQPSDPVEAARLRVPFAVDREHATATLRRWLGSRGYFAPPTLRDEAVLESLTPLCWAAWSVSARAKVAWTADSDHGSRRSDWAPHAGELEQTFDNIIVPASRGLSENECAVLVPYYDLARAVGVSAPEAAGEQQALIESFDTQRSAARQHVHRAIERIAAKRVRDHEVPGRRVRKVHVACLLERQTTTRVALPVWVLAYRYRGSPYRALVHGQRPDFVFGRSPLDWRKIARLVASVALAILAIVAAVLLLTGCGGPEPTPDAVDYTELCVAEQPTFAPLTGRAALKGVLNVHIDAGGVIMADTTSEVLLAFDVVQTGTQLTLRSQVCRISIPDVPLAGQDKPIHFEIPQATIDSIGVVDASATLESADTTCARLDTEPIVVVLGARMDPATITTAPLPATDEDLVYPACAPSATAPCATATGVDCACDQEGDGLPGATLIARNVPAIELDQVYVTLRTAIMLHGKVWSGDFVKGKLDSTFETGVLACKLLDGMMCGPNNLGLVRTLNPVITQQPGLPSTFRAVRIPAGMTCAEIVANQAMLFPR